MEPRDQDPSTTVPTAERSETTFAPILAAVLLGGLALRVAYLVLQPAHDPNFADPMIDGEIYMDWARALARGAADSGGAYYLAPLYPHFLGAFLRLFGENYPLLYLVQHLMTVCTAALLALAVRRRNGPSAGLATAVLVLLYPPLLFFAATPLGETLALSLLSCGILAVGAAAPWAVFGAGAAAGLASLGRPNLLLVAAAWVALAAFRRRFGRSALIAAGCVLVLFPVALRNYARSGHLVPISSNAGLTAYHGNGPQAQGLYTPVEGFSGRTELQREEATALARERSGLDLDPVEADRWWGRQALRARLADPRGTAKLLGWRLALLLDDHEHGLDYAPEMDRNPARPRVRLAGRELSLVSFALLLGLSGAALVLLGVRASAGEETWVAILACAATPLLFYVSSRYRLPLALLLTLPAGAGVAALLGSAGRVAPRRIATASILAAVLFAASLAVPSGSLQRASRGGALSNRALAHKQAGDLAAAERDARMSVELVPYDGRIWYNLGVVLEATGKLSEAERAYREALRFDPAQAEAAGNLGALLGRSGRTHDAIDVLRRALEQRPRHALCWNNLVAALLSSGDTPAAGAALDEAERRGVAVNPDLAAAVRQLDPGRGAGS